MAPAVDPDLGRAHHAWQSAPERSQKLGRHDDVSGRGNIDAVRERRPRQVRVEESDDSPDTRDTEPDGEVFRSVRHQQTNHFSLGEPLAERPASVAVRPFGQPAVAQRFAIGDQRRGRAGVPGHLVDDRRKNPRGILGDRCRQREGPRPRLGRGIVHAVFPASTVRIVPVMPLALSPSRNSTALTTSSTSGRR